MSFTLLKSDCPVCGGFRNGKKKHDCKQSGELIHCFSHNDPPYGFSFVGQSAIGQSIYAPARGDDYDHEKHRAELAQLRAENRAKAAKRRAELPTIPERDRHIRKFKAELTPDQNADLLRRGLAQDEINFALANHWLFACKSGYGIAAVDSVSGMLCGAQRAKDDRSPKYDWGIFTDQNQLKETGENPLFVWRSPAFNPAEPYEIKFCEGALKSLIRASMEWRKNPQIVVIGAAGGIFGDKALRRRLSVYPDPKKLTLLCDKDSQNLKKLNIYSAYKKLAEITQSIYGNGCNDVQLKFADWGQWRDAARGDCDETYGTKFFNQYKRRSPYEWLRPFDFEKIRKKAKARLKISDQLTPDITITHAEFKQLNAEKLDQLTNGARDVFINAFRGAGKTKIAALVTKLWKQMIAPYHRLSLARNGGGRVGCTYRTNTFSSKGTLYESDGESIQQVSKLAFCNEARLSLVRQINALLNAGAGVFTDEIDQQIKNLLMSSTHGKAGRRRLHWDGFWKDQTRGEKTLSVSADITDFEVQLFHRKTGRKPFVIKVEDQQKARVDTVFEDRLEWWANFLQLRSEGKRLLIVCSRKSDTEFFKFAFGAIAIHADNAAEYRELLDKPDPWLSQHKPPLMAVSPILGTGFSIEGNHFDAVLGLFHADNLNAKDLMQFLDRYRPNVPRFIWCEESNHQYDQLTPDAVFAARLARAKASETVENEAQWIDRDDPYFHYKAETNWSLAHLRADLLARLERDTETVHYVRATLTQDKQKAIRRNISDLRKAFKDADHKKTFDASDITPDEAKHYREIEDQLTEDQRRSLRKFELADWKVKAPDQLTLKDIQRDKRSKRRKALEKLEMQAFPQIAESLDHASVEKQIKHGISQQDIAHNLVRVQALDDIGISAALDFVLSGGEWTEDHPIVKTTAQNLRSKRDELKIMGVSLSCGKNASDNAYFGCLLKVFDLKTTAPPGKPKQETINGKRIRNYQLCPKDLALTKADLVARLPRNIERFGELTVKPETQWVTKLYELHTPFENIELEGCVQIDNPLLDIPELPPPEPQIIPPVRSESVAIAPELPWDILKAVQDAIMALNTGNRKPMRSLCDRLQNASIIHRAINQLEALGAVGLNHVFVSRWMFTPA